MTGQQIDEKLAIGCIINCAYKCRTVAGKVISFNKSKVLIEIHRRHFEAYTPTGEKLSITKNRIYEIN